MSDMLQELEVETRLGDYEREVAALMQEGMVVVEGQRDGVNVPLVVVSAWVLGAVIAVACARSDAKNDGGSKVILPVGRGGSPAVTREFTPAPAATATPTPEAPKPLPEVINKDTVIFDRLPAGEVQAMIDEAKEKGEKKIALPDVLEKQGIALVEIVSNAGNPSFAITATTEGTYLLPALAKGKIGQLLKGSGTLSSVSVRNELGEPFHGYIAPPGSQSRFFVIEGEHVSIGQPLAEVTYNPNTADGKQFIHTLKTQFRNAPENTIATIGGGRGGLTLDNILTTLRGAPIVVGNPGGKG